MAGLVLREDRDGLATLTLNRPRNSTRSTSRCSSNCARTSTVRSRARPSASAWSSCAARASASPQGTISRTSSKGERPPKPNFQSETIERLADLPQPVISAVHGHCYTGALELAAWRET